MAKTTVDVTMLCADVPVLAVFGGVDTHGRVHVAAALDQVGRLLGTRSFPATAAGYRGLRRWLVAFGALVAVGVEGTGSYGAGLARALSEAGVQVLEVDRPDRSARRRVGKDDELDAITAARAVAAGTATGTPKARTGAVEAIRAPRVARAGAVKARTAAFNQLKDLRLCAPEPLRAQLTGLSLPVLARTVAAWRAPAPGAPLRAGARPTARPVHLLADATTATRLAMRAIGRRVAELDTEITALDTDLAALVTATAPTLTGLYGVGTDTAGQLLVTAGDNPDRLRSEAALARLLGIAPIPASSGNTTRHRLHRGGDRHGNAAVHRIVIVRLRHDQRTRDFAAAHTAQGQPKPMIIRSLKRYIVREVYRALMTDLNNPKTTPSAA
ncbi:MAG: IS110 family transposase [Pseudonocardiaceae bacterium]